MKQLIVVVALSVASLASVPAFAKADCKAYPKAEWMPQADAKAKIEAQGYTISKFKVDGNCYEIYGRNKAGKKVEIYYDAKTLEPVKSEIEK
ncbi:PepSY domain-containing protein [Variovorax saccharolyticus]|uniref:PepSY domain-containing protein n=1 Tax=Variovorax saccharolyticus TaxID=3053516 RepID=UPI002576695F|nr:PepSY domain-containing protein [Variovorax sp. J31P216]MDM0025598.1 PepSY domain-containing protein [Variovorax sp. J31P216]